MHTQQFTHDTVKMLGVHGLAVYMLMRCAEAEGLVPITHQWIFDHMPGKTSVNTVTAELRRLTSPERQIAIRVKGGWRLNLENVFQLPLEYLLESENLSERDSESPVVVVVVESEESKKNKSTTTTIRSENLSERDSRKTEMPESEILRRKNLATFQELGILSSKSEKVAALEWVTPDYIRAHVADAKKKPGIDNPEGFALTRMEYQAPVPENSVTGKENRTGYNGGAFAELLQRDDDDERVSVCCWQDDLPEIFKSGPYQGQHMKARRCGKPCKAGSYKWCEEHYEIGTATYDSENEAA